MNTNMISDKCCDTCIYYEWYYDICNLYHCETDSRAMCNRYKTKLTDDENGGIIEEKRKELDG